MADGRFYFFYFKSKALIKANTNKGGKMEREKVKNFSITNLDHLTRWLTGYSSFKELYRNNPTLRIDRNACPTLKHRLSMCFLRYNYLRITGKSAFA